MRIWLILGLAATSVSALAQDDRRWIPVATSTSGIFFELDRNSIQRSGSRVTLWERRTHVPPTSRGVSVSNIQEEYDCDARTSTLIAGIEYNVAGALMSTETVEPDQRLPDPILSDSMNERVLREVCPAERRPVQRRRSSMGGNR
jgi:hypothetical protein